MEVMYALSWHCANINNVKMNVMRCTMCHRPLSEATVTIKTRGGPLGWGPKCAKKAGLIKPKQRMRRADAHKPCAETVDWVEGVM